MNKSLFLSADDIFNLGFRFEKKHTFISEDIFEKKKKAFQLLNYQEMINTNYVKKSAIARKWSIKFR